MMSGETRKKRRRKREGPMEPITNPHAALGRAVARPEGRTLVGPSSVRRIAAAPPAPRYHRGSFDDG